jgi:hypothetical protein
VRLSEFWRAVTDEFGEVYGRALVRDLVLDDIVLSDIALSEVGDVTAERAIAAGVPVRDIWLALCAAMQVPSERRYGVGQVRKGR